MYQLYLSFLTWLSSFFLIFQWTYSKTSWTNLAVAGLLLIWKFASIFLDPIQSFFPCFIQYICEERESVFPFSVLSFLPSFIHCGAGLLNLLQFLLISSECSSCSKVLLKCRIPADHCALVEVWSVWSSKSFLHASWILWYSFKFKHNLCSIHDPRSFSFLHAIFLG